MVQRVMRAVVADELEAFVGGGGADDGKAGGTGELRCSRARSMQLTLASLPQRWRCLAAASPSPALFPTPQTTAVRFGQNLATCQPAASISQSTEMPKRSCASASTSLT